MIESSGSRLTLYAAPFAEAARVRPMIDPSSYVVYVIDDPWPNTDQPSYIGHGDRNRRWGDRFTSVIKDTTQIYFLTSDAETLDKVKAPYTEGRLIQICTDLDVPLLNTSRPYGSGLRVRPEPEQLVGDAEALLHIAGFTRIDQARRSPPAVRRRLSVTSDRDEMVVMTAEETSTVRQEGEHHRLICRDLQADGYKWRNRFYVKSGADYACKSRSGLSEDHKQRRFLMEAAEWVEPTSAQNRMTLRVGFHCRSGAFAAKLLTGEHVDEDMWQAVETTPTRTPTQPGEASL